VVKKIAKISEAGFVPGAGWYVLAVEDGSPRQLKAAEDEIVNEFRFAPRPTKQ
jgi:hypothetical protein